jgi:hypothetical protein
MGFAITEQTGADKITILDAIGLACINIATQHDFSDFQSGYIFNTVEK